MVIDILLYLIKWQVIECMYNGENKVCQIVLNFHLGHVQ